MVGHGEIQPYYSLNPSKFSDFLSWLADEHNRRGPVLALGDDVQVWRSRRVFSVQNGKKPVRFAEGFVSYWRCPERGLRFSAGDGQRGPEVDWDALPADRSLVALSPRARYDGMGRLALPTSTTGEFRHLELPSGLVAAAYTRTGWRLDGE